MTSSIVCAGSIALDTTRTPFKTVERVLGGAASYFSLAASFFASVHVTSVVGEDFPQEYWEILSKRMNLQSVERKKNGKTMFFDSTFSYDLYHRHANKTELNVLSEFGPTLSPAATQSEFVYLATMPPEKQMLVLEQIKNKKIVFMDTIEFYIKNSQEKLLEVMKKTNGVILNDNEARMLTNESNLIKCGRQIRSLGPEIVVLKKGEHGSILFYKEKVIPFPAFPLEVIVDPTGAGDAFAGGLVGALARQKSTKPTIEQLKVALAYANVMGSLAVEDFSVDKLVQAKSSDVERRFYEYCQLLKI